MYKFPAALGSGLGCTVLSIVMFTLSLQAALAAIVVVALKGLYLQVRDIYKYYRLSPADMVNLSMYTSTV